MTKLIYNGIDITNDIEIKSCSLHDNAGDGADDAIIVFPDSEKIWGKWAPVRGDSIIVRTDDYSTGKLYIDSYSQGAGVFTIQALSTPLTAKRPKNRIWRNVRFTEIAADIARNHEFALKTYGITDFTYSVISQVNQSDIDFLNRVCIREGYCCKVTDGKLIIFNEQFMESLPATITITPEDVYPGYNFSVADELLENCTVLYCPPGGNLISYTASSGMSGQSGRVFELLSNIAEAERWAKGYLRYTNKNRISSWLSMKLSIAIASASVINISGFGAYDGKYYISNVSQDTVRNKSFLGLRKVGV